MTWRGLSDGVVGLRRRMGCPATETRPRARGVLPLESHPGRRQRSSQGVPRLLRLEMRRSEA